MKEILARDLKVGDVFIDEDVYAVALSQIETYVYLNPYYLKVKCIVGPTTGTYTKPGKVYYISIYKKVLLCEE